MRTFKGGRKPLAHKDRFFTNRQSIHHPALSPCWIWRGGKTSKGYGRIWVNGKTISAHRYAWELTNGLVLDGMFVCHHCDRRNCIRPEHLFLGTNSDNMKDMVQKGRRGMLRQNTPKLAALQIEEIRVRYRRGLGLVLAKQYGVSLATIMNYVHGYYGKRKEEGQIAA